jgi:hypothetical protein
MLTPEKWMEEVQNSVTGKNEPSFSMKQGEFCRGCPAYSKGFDDKFASTKEITGLTRVHVCRFSMHPTEDKVEFHVKAHATGKGWHPRCSYLSICVFNA